MDCTLCGREVEKIFKAEVEGSIVEVCENCLKFGRKIEEVKPPIKKKPEPTITLPEEETIMIHNYGKVIKETREKKGLTRNDFAKNIKEKESVIRRIEMEEMVPDEKLKRKIERFLEISLTEKYEEKGIESKSRKETLTLGDVVEVE